MTLNITKFFIIFWLLTVTQLSKAESITLLLSNNLEKDTSVDELTKAMQQKYSAQTGKLSQEITLAIGIQAIEKALDSNQSIHIATTITEAETLQLTRKYPDKLKNTLLVLRQAGFKCQMDLFKNHPTPSNKPLGILLKNETLNLYPFIQNYAGLLAINVSTWQIQLNESLSDGLHHLMKQQDVFLLLAMSEFNQSSQLPVLIQESQILKKRMIASSEYQIEMGVSQGCIIKNKDWIATVMHVIEKINDHQKIKSNYQLSKEQLNFKIVMPTISIVE